MTRRGLLLAARPPTLGIVFTARGASGFLNPDRRLEIIGASGTRQLPVGQGCYGTFPNGDLLVQDLELPADWREKTFDEYYPRSQTRISRVNPRTGAHEPLAHRERLSNFVSPCCLAGDRLVVTAMLDGKSVLHTMDLDGRQAHALTGPREFVYGVSLSPDGQWFAFHADYRIHVCRVDGSERREIAAVKGQLCFGTQWSPDSEHVLFQVCDSKQDPAHDWARVASVRRAGRDWRWWSPPASAWFGATYGPPKNPGGGSNIPLWTSAGILYVKRTAGAVPPWEYQTRLRDTDHFNRDYRPEKARGGAHLALVDPATGDEKALTRATGGVWDFRPATSQSTHEIAFCRAKVGHDPELWTVDQHQHERRLTTGLRRAGVDHPRFLS